MKRIPAANLTDDELATRAAFGDRSALDRLFDRHARPVAAILLRRLPPAAAERALTAVLDRARRQADSMDGDPRAWLFRQARPILDTAPKFAATDDATALELCLGERTDAERELLRVRFGGPDDLPATATRLGLDPGAARERVTEALVALRECVERRTPPGPALLLPTVPDHPGELAAWLDGQVAGPDLGRLIGELSAVHRPTAGVPNLDEVLGRDREAVLADGLRALPPDRLRLLLRHPGLLGDVQDTVAEVGGPYWGDRFDHPTLSGLVHRARLAAADAEAARRAQSARRDPVYRRPWFVAVVTTVVVLVTVYLNRPPPPPRWGWTRPAVMARGDTPGEHLNALANAAADWRDRPKATPTELRSALREMRDGCTALLAAGHPELGPADHHWLVEQAVVWGNQFDRQLANLQSGRPPDEVHRSADETVDAIIRQLRARAGEE